MRTVLCLSILLCVASSASAQIVQETTVYPGGYQHVANVTGPLGIFGYPVYAPVPPRAVTRTYDLSPPVIVEERVVREVYVEPAPKPAEVIKQRTVVTPRKTVVRTYFGSCRNPYCTCAPCRCGNSCRCGR